MESREEAKQQSLLEVEPLASEASLQSLSLLRQLVTSSLGPRGHIKTVQNAVGGHVTMTTNSSRLFSAVSFSRPVLQMVINSVQRGARRTEDGGLRTCFLALRLLESSLSKGEHDIPAVLMSDLYDECLSLALEYLRLDQHQTPLDKFNLTFLTSVARTVLMSKPFCALHGETLDKMTSLVLEAFVNSLTDDRNQPSQSDGIFIVGLDKSATENSACYRGLLIECPQLSTVSEKPLRIRESASGSVKVALLTVSAAGDADWALDAQYEVCADLNVEDEVKESLGQLAEQLVDAGVGLLLSQRVVHPAVKSHLTSAGILCVDRLGVACIPYVRDLTGADPISLDSDLKEVREHLGCLDRVSHKVLFAKSFLQLQRKDSPVVSLVLTSPWEERTEELKVTVRAALRALEAVYCEARAVPGAGCWNTQLAAYVQQAILGNIDSFMEKHGCSRYQMLWAANNFASCLNQLARTLGDESDVPYADTTHHHCWRVPRGVDLTLKLAESESLTCACGLITSHMVHDFEMLMNEKLSVFEVERSSFTVRDTKSLCVRSDVCLDSAKVAEFIVGSSIETACTLLRIGQSITDCN